MQHWDKSVTACAQSGIYSVHDEGFEHRSDVLTHDKVGDVVELGRLAIDDDKPAPLRFAINGKPAAGQTKSDEPIARNRSQ